MANGRETLATDVIMAVKRKLWKCRIVLLFSLAVNVIQAVVIIRMK